MFGEDFAGGWFRRIYQPSNPAGVGIAIAVAIGLVLLHQGLQILFATGVLVTLFSGAFEDTRSLVKASLIVIFPASLVIAWAAWKLAGVKGGEAPEVLSLRTPRITPVGWAAVITGFLIAMYAAILIIVMVLGIDLDQYTPGPDGTSPDSGSAGLVKEAMFDIANEPWMFLLVFPSIAFGAPIAEEIIFRGQLFSALSRTWLGVSGTAVVTSAAWALLHMSEPWFSIGLIFIMGLVFGWLMYRFGSLWIVMACHGAWNGIYALILFSTLGGQS